MAERFKYKTQVVTKMWVSFKTIDGAMAEILKRLKICI